MLKIGDRVRLTEACKAVMLNNGSREHIEEFGDSIGTVEGLVRYSDTVEGPEVDVRWLPSRLRYGYHPDDLESVE